MADHGVHAVVAVVVVAIVAVVVFAVVAVAAVAVGMFSPSRLRRAIALAPSLAQISNLWSDLSLVSIAKIACCVCLNNEFIEY